MTETIVNFLLDLATIKTFWVVVIGLVFLDFMLSGLSAKKCDICGSHMMEYDDKPHRDYCPNEHLHPKTNIYDKD